MMKKYSSFGKHRMMWILISVFLVFSLLLSGCGGSQQKKVYHVGILSGLDIFSPAVDGFKEKMTELGYEEGKDIIYDVQETKGVDQDAYKSITEKFVNDKVDMIFVFPTAPSLVAKAATQGTDIPVVFALAFTDAKGVDLVDSVREPGGNITGVRFVSADVASERLEILLDMVPNARRVFVPYLKDYPNVPGQLEKIRPQAQASGVELVEFPTTDPQELQAKLDSFVTTDGVGIDAILMLAEPLGDIPSFYDVMGKFAYEHQVPIGGALRNIDGDYSSIFGLLPDPKAVGELAATLADKIFSGSTAGKIPVLTSEDLLQINYKAAQDLGVTVSEGLLKRADEIVR